MTKKATYINMDMLEPLECSDVYSSTMLMGDDLVGESAINMNRGTLKAGARLPGGVHEKAEIYYVVDCQEGAEVVTGQGEEEVRHKVKPGDTIFIPGGCFHWIDNQMCDKNFEIMTLWPHQEDNEVYFVRKEKWGTNFKFRENAVK